MHAHALDVKHLTASYGDTCVLEDISFVVPLGKVFMIIGPSGCGKSTLLNHLIGLRKPKHGHVFILGKDISHANPLERTHILKNMGVAYQSGALFGSMNLLDNVALPLEELTNLSNDEIKQIAKTKLALVGLEQYSGYFPSEISGGMQKRAAIARAMALDPKILFLDEPSAGLDPITSNELDKLIKTLSKKLKVTFVIVSHELRSIFNIADMAIMLNHKKIVGEGHPNLLRQSDDPYIRQFFSQGPEDTL